MPQLYVDKNKNDSILADNNFLSNESDFKFCLRFTIIYPAKYFVSVDINRLSLSVRWFMKKIYS